MADQTKITDNAPSMPGTKAPAAMKPFLQNPSFGGVTDNPSFNTPGALKAAKPTPYVGLMSRRRGRK